MTSTAPTAVTTAFSAWNIDPAHSAAEFKVRHMMISYVKGKFSGLSGVLKLDETDYTHSSVEVSIPAASVRTVDDKLDATRRMKTSLTSGSSPRLHSSLRISDPQSIMTTQLPAIWRSAALPNPKP